MISVIVSSYNEKNYTQFAASVQNTIGIEFELIKIYNPGKMGIAAAYNKGAAKAKYPYLCFIHEDVSFKTHNWGKLLIDHFKQDEALGLLGIAGSNYKSYVFSGLGSTWGDANLRMNIMQPTKQGVQLLTSKNTDANIEQVVLVDGCFMCTTAKVFSQVHFDEKTFKGFHCYDIDYSLSLNRYYKAAVVYDILIEHFSAGGFDKQWLDETCKLHKKWQEIIPYSLKEFSRHEIYYQEAGAYYFLLSRVMKLRYGLRYFIRINFSRKLINLVGISKWLWMQIKLPLNIIRLLVSE